MWLQRLSQRRLLRDRLEHSCLHVPTPRLYMAPRLKIMSNLGPNKSKRTTDTVSFRVESELRKILEHEAELNGVSLNTLVSQIFSQYVRWWRYVRKLGFLPMSKELLRDLFQSVPPEKMEEAARTLGGSSFNEDILFLFRQVNTATVIRFLDLWSSHFDAFEHTHDGKRHFYTVHHDINANFSQFIKEYVTTAFQSTLKIAVHFEDVSRDSVTFSFEA